MKLFDNLRDPNLRVNKAIMFVDIADSTGMKERETEAAWLTTFGCVYDVIAEVIESGSAGTIVKFLGDGAIVAYSEDHATNAINDAIHIQEAITDDVEKHTLNVHVSVGISLGEVVEFSTDGKTHDYLGIVVDRAARLCSIASPDAIFVDTATTDCAQMNRVRSKIGEALRRKTEEYQGSVERASVPGFVAPVEYHEIKWAASLHGVKSKVVTAAADAPRTSAPVALPRPVATLHGRRGVRGVVKMWDSEKGRGWFVAADGEEFYTDTRYVVGEDDLERDDIVYFCPSSPLDGGKCRLATATVFVGQEDEGYVVKAPTAGFGFVQVKDDRGNPQDIFFSVDEAPDDLQCGELVGFVLAETGRGVRAEEISRRSPETKAA